MCYTIQIQNLDTQKPKITTKKVVIDKKVSIKYTITEKNRGDKGIKKIWIQRQNNNGKYVIYGDPLYQNSKTGTTEKTGTYKFQESGKYRICALDHSGRTSKSKIYAADYESPKIKVKKNGSGLDVETTDNIGLKSIWIKKLNEKTNKYELVEKRDIYYGEKEAVIKFWIEKSGKYIIYVQDKYGNKAKSKIYFMDVVDPEITAKQSGNRIEFKATDDYGRKSIWIESGGEKYYYDRPINNSKEINSYYNIDKDFLSKTNFVMIYVEDLSGRQKWCMVDLKFD